MPLPSPLDMSDPERALQTMLRWADLPEPEWEYRFLPDRKFRFDCCWPALQLAIEINGGQWLFGRHNRPGAGYERDLEKLNLAALGGWLVLQFTPRMLAESSAIMQIEQAYLQRLEAL